jgi:hypothetical protein
MELVERWASYLRHRGHHVKRPQRNRVVVSRNGEGRRYRWVILCAAGATRPLTPHEKRHLWRQSQIARRKREDAYVVVHFEPPVDKLLVLPAESVLKNPRVSAAKGGISWEEEWPQE